MLFEIKQDFVDKLPQINDKNKLMRMAKRDWLNMRRASSKLLEDRDVALYAIQECGFDFQSTKYNYYNDKNFIIEVMKKRPNLYKQLSPILQNDKDIALAAVKEDSYAYTFLSEELQDDRDVALAAAKAHTMSPYRYSELFKVLMPKHINDSEIIEACFARNKEYAGKYAPDNFKDSKTFIYSQLYEMEGNVLFFNWHIGDIISDELKADAGFMKSVIDKMFEEGVARYKGIGTWYDPSHFVEIIEISDESIQYEVFSYVEERVNQGLSHRFDRDYFYKQLNYYCPDLKNMNNPNYKKKVKQNNTNTESNKANKVKCDYCGLSYDINENSRCPNCGAIH